MNRIGLILIGILAGGWVAQAQTESCQSSFRLDGPVILCAPDSTALIQAWSAWDVLSLQWELPPNTEVLDSATVRVTTKGTATVIARASLRSPNLIVNGDFSNGNSGFTSELAHSPLTLLPPNTYAVTTNPANVHPDFKPCSDHTTGTGRMLASNGNLQPNRNVWCQNVPVEPFGEYTLAFWAAALTENELPQLVFRIDGQNIGTPLVPGPETCQWITTGINWTAGMQTSAQVCIRNLNGSNSGNDFALDDIEMIRYCETADTLTVSYRPLQSVAIDTLMCQGDSLVVAGSVFNTSTSTTLVLEDQWGCDSLIRLDLVVIDPGLAIAVPDTLNCRDTLIQLTASASFPAGNPVWQWLGPDGMIIPGGNGPTLQVSQPGSYQVVWTLTTPAGGCKVSAGIAVTNDVVVPLASAGSDQWLTCAQPEVVLTGDTGAGAFEYDWKNLDGPDPLPANQRIVTADAPGRYVFTVSNPVNFCSASDTIIVGDSRKEIGPVDLSILAGRCAGEPARLDVLDVAHADQPWEVRLTNDQGQVFTNGPPFFLQDPGIYSLEVRDNGGCTVQQEIEVPAPGTLDFSLPLELSAQVGQVLQVAPMLGFPENWVTAYQWSAPGLNLSCSDCAEVTLSGFGEAVLTLCIEVGDVCRVCRSLPVRFEGAEGMFIPSAFSPNGDGINDVFRPFPAPGMIKSFQRMEVYNRWGGRVFAWLPGAGGQEIPGWNGEVGGQRAQADVYIYLLEGERFDGQILRWSGEVQLVR